MTHRRLPVAIAAALIVLVAAIVFMLSDSAGDVGTAAPIAPNASVTPADATPSTATTTELASAAPLRVPDVIVEPVLAPVSEDGVPESYRAALGGLTGRVIEENGTPVPDIPVEIVGGRATSFQQARMSAYADTPPVLDLIQASAITDQDGRFHMTNIEPRTMGGLLVDPGGPRSALRILDIQPTAGETHDLGDIVLAAAVTLTGRIVDATGAPISGVRVRSTDIDYAYVVLGLQAADFRDGGAGMAEIPESDGGGPPVFVAPPGDLTRMIHRLPIPETVTGDDGRFTIQGVPPGLATIILDDGFHQIAAHGPNPTGPAGGERDVGDLPMLDGLELNGRVVDDNGDPVPGAIVYGGNNIAGAPITVALLHPFVEADELGQFTVQGLRDQLASVAVRRPDDLHYTFYFDASPGGELFDVVVPSRRTLTVTVVNEAREPLGGVEFWGLPLMGEESSWDKFLPAYVFPRHALKSRTTLDEEDHYVISDMDPRPWKITARAPGHALLQVDVDLSDLDQSIEMVLETAHDLEVLVRRAHDGTPVEHALVEAWWDDDNEAPLTAVRSDVDGRVTLAQLPEGEYQIRATYPALAVTQATATVPDDTSLTMALEVGGTVHGLVIESGEPPPEPMFVTMNVEGDEDIGDGALPHMTVTLLDGTFAFYNVQPGEVEIEVRERLPQVSGFNFVDLFINSPLASTTLDVPVAGDVETVLVVGSEYADLETARLSGRLTVNGRPGDGWKVRVWGDIRRSATVEPDGRFEMGLLAAGETVISFTPPGSQLQGIAGVASEELVLEPNTVEYREFELAMGAIEGRVRSAIDGRLQAGVGVTAVPVEQGGKGRWFNRPATVTLEDGSYRIEPVTAGRYRVRAEKETFATTSSEEFEVRQMQTVRGIEIGLMGSLTMTGRVVLEGQETLPEWMWLVARSEDGANESASVNAEDGSFELDGLGPGTYTIDIGSGADVEFESLERTITADASNVVLTFKVVSEVVEEAEVDEEG